MQHEACVMLVLSALASLKMVPGPHWNGCGVTLDTSMLPHAAEQHALCVMLVSLALAAL
jgi:hypothetical protein